LPSIDPMTTALGYKLTQNILISKHLLLY